MRIYNGIGTTRLTIFETNADNSYLAVGRVDLVGVFSFYAGTMQAADIDNDGTEEIVVCIDDNFLILKFNGSRDHHTYELYYIKKNELVAAGENSVYFGAIVNDLKKNGEFNFLISMDQVIEQGATGRCFTRVYKPDSLTFINDMGNNIIESSDLKTKLSQPFQPFDKNKIYYSRIKQSFNKCLQHFRERNKKAVRRRIIARQLHNKLGSQGQQ